MSSEKITNPTMACRACGYVLDGLPLSRCPECSQAFDPQDRSTFVVIGPGLQVSGWQRLRRIGLLTGFLLVFSLGYYWSTEGTTVANDRSSRERVVRIGVPVPWLTWSSATDPSLTATSPWGFRPGLDLSWLRLGLSFSCLAVLAFVLDWLTRFIRRRFPLWRPQPTRPTLPTAVLVGLGVGSCVPTDPEWIGVILGFCLVPACLLIVTWRGRSYGSILVAAGVTVLSLSWSARISDLFRPTHLVHRVTIENDLVAPLVFWGLYSLLLLSITWLRRAFAAR
ncbi:MAG: hypothetical protein GX616_15205 [Planctomycetes bacterium]|nr:hypothetical protein [Planctomycetota bacterium]